MTTADKLQKEGWDHDPGDHRIEDLLALETDLDADITKYALRFISEQGLSENFADILEEIVKDRARSPQDSSPDKDGPGL